MSGFLRRALAMLRSGSTPIRTSRFGRVFGEVRVRVRDEHIPLLAAALSYYGMLAIVPGLIAFVSIYGLVADVGDVAALIETVGRAAPAEVTVFLEGQLTDIVEAPRAGLGLSAAVSLVVALVAASSGTKALIRGVNIAFGIEERRNAVRLRLVSLALTVGTLLFTGSALLVLSVGATWSGGALDFLRWPLLLVAVIAGLAILYRVAPATGVPGRRIASYGALAAALGWLAASYGFGFYASRFGSFNETYGALGAVIVTMLWLFVSGFVVLAGAVLDGVLGAGD